MNVLKLKAKIVENEIKRDDIAKALNKDNSTITRKMQRGDFTVEEATKLRNLLNLSLQDACDIFLS